MRGGPAPVVGHRLGALFDPRIKASGQDDPATSTTSNGVEIRFSACLASPPATSYVRVRTDERLVRDPSVVAAHGDLLLIGTAVARPEPPLYCSVDWFVHRADPAGPWLRRLPCDGVLMHPAGIISLGGDEFIVASLQLIRTHEGMDRPALAERGSVKVTGLRRLELPYLFRYSSSTDLCEHKQLAMPYDGDALKPFQWEWFTDKVFAADSSTMYWVDLHRGLLCCDDVAADSPELCFIPLPEIEIWKDIVDRWTFPEINRTVGVYKGLVRFFDVDNGRFETRRPRTRFTVTTWVLNKVKAPADRRAP